MLLLLTTSAFGARHITHFNFTSISGDCAMLRTNSDDKTIGVLSTSILNTDDKNIWTYSFRGDGFSTNASRSPSVNSSTVYDSLFHDDAFVRVFITEADTLEARFTVSRSKLRKINLIVKEADKPFTVGATNLSYFWGADKLPVSSIDCAEFLSSNDIRKFTHCNLTKSDRCAALISDFPHIAPFRFRSALGKRITHFAWLCPAGTECCAWECCVRIPGADIWD
ncbi:hypothetical protein PMAYCL1PPCAC_27595 [Pristionchus mayeri]|uniref:Uncharacterized protein n=1 Tax=Pristionchus mayeri TaxID=1317129 RepID=A0AAN5D846_9BILA|nr:hypothetical protein PMAYCL1PPCAC_27595 [Pristionchus mayeri]